MASIMVDTLIIGSGVAATAVAQRLLEADPFASVTILEAGNRIKTKDFALWEDYLLTGKLPYDPYKDLKYPARETPGENASVGGTIVPLEGARVFGYGGSTMHWGGWSFRMKPEDFYARTNCGEAIDWPFDYDVLEPYYCQAEAYLAVAGNSSDPSLRRSQPYPFRHFPFTLEDRPVIDAFETLSIRYGHLPIARRGHSEVPSRHAPCQTTGTCKYCPFGARFVASNYLDDLAEWNDFPNLELKLGAVVQSIRTAGKSRAVGVTYVDRTTGNSVDLDAQRIILAAGAIESAKLLLRSTPAEWPEGVGNDHDLVGRHLVTHPFLIFAGTLPANPMRLQAEMDFPTLVSRHFDSLAEQKSGKYILVNPADPAKFSLARRMQSGYSRAEIDAALTGPTTFEFNGMLEVFGRFQNRVANHPKVNRLGMIETSVDYTMDPGFEARIGEIREVVAKVYAAMGATVPGKPSVSWRADHAASVCRMSPDPSQGVVDADLRVHGVDNLYVCSNAVMPNIGAVNPTLTLTALALKLGDHLRLKSRLGERHVVPGEKVPAARLAANSP